MDKRFFITEIRICTFDRSKENLITPNYNYPERYCVVDKENKIAIDILDELQYDYIETMSRLYFLNKSYEKIRDNKRAAIHPNLVLYVEDLYLNKALDIIKKLENGYKFVDGNDIYNNEEFLKHVENQKQQSKNEPVEQKLKKIRHFNNKR